MKKTIYLFSILLFISGCGACGKNFKKIFNIGEGENMTIEKHDITNTYLRFDGYYYCLSETDPKYDVWFIYKNGVCSYIDIWANNIQELDLKVNSKINLSKTKDRTFYGLFQINQDSSIEFERWHNSSGQIQTPLFHYEGKIQNDTSFILHKSWRPENPDEFYLFSMEYHFRKNKFKPDNSGSLIDSLLNPNISFL